RTMRRLFPCTRHIGQKSRSAGRRLVEDLVAANAVETDGRRVDQHARVRIDDAGGRLDAAAEDLRPPLLRPALSDVLAGEIDDRVDSGSFIALQDDDLVSTRAQPLDDGAADEPGPAGDRDA